jgi:uncharacterized membrane protein
VNELVAIAYPDMDTAERVRRELVRASDEGLARLEDAVVVERTHDGKVRLHQLRSMAKHGAAVGAAGGAAIGLLFLAPLLGAAIGAATGALAGSLTDVGIDDAFINKVRDQVTPGTSALFVMTSDAVIDKVKDAFEGGEKAELIFTNLTHEQEAALREVFTA